MSHDRIPLAGVIGSPIAHSKSPRLFAHWLGRLGIRGHYIPMDVDPRDLGQMIESLPKLGFVGINVTIPHKERILDHVDLISDRATLIGAANTLIFRKDGRVHADNTDGFGFLENLKARAPAEWTASGGPAVVLGAGGASRAVVSALLDAGCPEILLTNRTRARAEQIKEDFGARVKVVEWVKAGNILDGVNVVVNTTALGMTGKPDLRVPLDGLKTSTLVTDLVYTPLETPLLLSALERGCPIVDGLGMLIHQAIPGFERWFGEKPPVDDEVRRILLA